MKELLLRCNENVMSMPCCHSDGRICYCYDCLREGFYHMPDTYECAKKMNYYVLNYGPSYASEIYHYLSNSNILETLWSDKKLRILSLGCGFGPDLVAIERYVDDKNLPIQFEYYGIDESTCWDTARYDSENATFAEHDVVSSLNLSDCDLIFIVKLFSTLYKHKLHNHFLSVFNSAVNTQLKDDGIVVFNDINSIHMGRDVFHDAVKHLFKQCRQFYCDDPEYTEPGWIKIPDNKVVFSIEFEQLSIFPLLDVGETVFFEYRK